MIVEIKGACATTHLGTITGTWDIAQGRRDQCWVIVDRVATIAFAAKFDTGKRKALLTAHANTIPDRIVVTRSFGAR